MLQLISTTVGMQDLTRGLNPVQVKSINKAVRGVQVRCVYPSDLLLLQSVVVQFVSVVSHDL